jgi:hypothetical protein
LPSAVAARDGIVDDLIRMYRKENKRMASTIEELNRKIIKEALETASPKDRVKGLTPAERFEGLSADELLKLVDPEDIEKYLRGLKRKKPRKK